MEHTVNSPASVNGRMENRTLRERVYEVLRDDILSGHLGPGAELSEVALAERLGVSRGPIREALSLLCAQGLVTMQPRRGAYVSVLTRQEFLEAYQVREALEALAARLASARLQDEDIAALEALHEEMRGAVRDRAIQRFFDANQRFHLSLVALSGNGRLIEMHDQLVQRMGRYMARSLSLRGNLERSLSEHEQIIDALRARDAARAAAAVSLHIQVPQMSMEQIPDEVFATMESGATGTAAATPAPSASTMPPGTATPPAAQPETATPTATATPPPATTAPQTANPPAPAVRTPAVGPAAAD